MRSKRRSIFLWVRVVVAVLLLLVIIGPFFLPLPALSGTQPPSALAYPGSRFIEIQEIDLHYQEHGQGEPVYILLHGFLSSTYSWREVVEPLSESGRVIAYDRPAYGLTERPLEWSGHNPYSFTYQPDLLVALMDALDINRAILVGNSAGGTVAAAAALRYPERVQALVLVDAAIYTRGGPPSWSRVLLKTPQAERAGLWAVRKIESRGSEFARMAWHNPDQLSPQVWEGYRRPLQADNWDQALWQVVLAEPAPPLASRLSELDVPVLVVTGDDDRIVPTEESVRLAGEIPGAQLAVVPNCGHVPHEECPQAFLQALQSWLAANYLR